MSGPDFTVETDVRLLRWDDIVAEDMELPVWRRLPRYLSAAADILVTGTFRRYAAAYWRYSFFAAYPLVLLALFAVLGWGGSLAWAKAGWARRCRLDAPDCRRGHLRGPAEGHPAACTWTTC